MGASDHKTRELDKILEGRPQARFSENAVALFLEVKRSREE